MNCTIDANLCINFYMISVKIERDIRMRGSFDVWVRRHRP